VLSLLALNLAFAALVGVVLWRWRVARRAVTPVADEGRGVDLRVRLRPRDDELAERWVGRALGQTDLVPVGDGRWEDRRGAAARLTPGVVGDPAVLVEVPAERADAVLAALIEVVLAEGYEIGRTRGRRVTLRRGPDRVQLTADPA